MSFGTAMYFSPGCMTAMGKNKAAAPASCAGRPLGLEALTGEM